MIYFDHNASTPVRPEVRRRHAAACADLHAQSLERSTATASARAPRSSARASRSRRWSARVRGEVVFTSGGTEGDHARA